MPYIPQPSQTSYSSSGGGKPPDRLIDLEELTQSTLPLESREESLEPKYIWTAQLRWRDLVLRDLTCYWAKDRCWEWGAGEDGYRQLQKITQNKGSFWPEFKSPLPGILVVCGDTGAEFWILLLRSNMASINESLDWVSHQQPWLPQVAKKLNDLASSPFPFLFCSLQFYNLMTWYLATVEKCIHNHIK